MNDFPKPTYTVFDAIRHIALRAASADDLKRDAGDAQIFYDAQGRAVYLMCGLHKSLTLPLLRRNAAGAPGRP